MPTPDDYPFNCAEIAIAHFRPNPPFFPPPLADPQPRIVPMDFRRDEFASRWLADYYDTPGRDSGD